MPIKSENTIHEPDDQDGEACRQLITNPRYRQYRLQNDGPYFFRSLIWGVYQNRQYTDFVIRVKDSQKEFHVHRAVICPQSQIFEAACRGTFVEASERSITLTDDEPEIVEPMIRYLYTHRYDDAEDWNYECCNNGIKRIRQHYSEMSGAKPSEENKNQNEVGSRCESWARQNEYGSSSSSSARASYDSKESSRRKISLSPASPPKSLRVYAIADKYLVLPLKDLARARFSSWASSHWWTKGFVASAREIFDNETGNYNDLKEIILSIITLHADTLLCNGAGIQCDSRQEINQFLQEYSEVSTEILRRTLDRSRIRQRGLEVDIADLESRVNALRVENKKVAVLQSRNNSLNKELMQVRMVLLAWKRDLRGFRNEGSSSSAR